MIVTYSISAQWLTNLLEVVLPLHGVLNKEFFIIHKILFKLYTVQFTMFSVHRTIPIIPNEVMML